MIWDRAMESALALIDANPVLSALYGSNVRLADGQTPATNEDGELVDTLEWTLIADSDTELFNPFTIQFDQWCGNLASLRASERALRNVFTAPLMLDLAGVPCLVEYAGGDVLAVPNRDAYHARAIRFRFSPVREPYASQES